MSLDAAVTCARSPSTPTSTTVRKAPADRASTAVPEIPAASERKTACVTAGGYGESAASARFAPWSAQKTITLAGSATGVSVCWTSHSVTAQSSRVPSEPVESTHNGRAQAYAFTNSKMGDRVRILVAEIDSYIDL